MILYHRPAGFHDAQQRSTTAISSRVFLPTDVALEWMNNKWTAWPTPGRVAASSTSTVWIDLRLEHWRRTADWFSGLILELKWNRPWIDFWVAADISGRLPIQKQKKNWFHVPTWFNLSKIWNHVRESAAEEASITGLISFSDLGVDLRTGNAALSTAPPSPLPRSIWPIWVTSWAFKVGGISWIQSDLN